MYFVNVFRKTILNYIYFFLFDYFSLGDTFKTKIMGFCAVFLFSNTFCTLTHPIIISAWICIYPSQCVCKVCCFTSHNTICPSKICRDKQVTVLPSENIKPRSWQLLPLLCAFSLPLLSRSCFFACVSSKNFPFVELQLKRDLICSRLFVVIWPSHVWYGHWYVKSIS